MDDWTNYTLKIAEDLLLENKRMDEETTKQFNDIANYCRGVSHNPLGGDRTSTNPKFNFNYDIQKWINEIKDIKLKEFKFSSTKIEFILSNDQVQLVEDKLTIFGNTPSGRSQAIKRIPIQMLWRIPRIIVN